MLSLLESFARDFGPFRLFGFGSVRVVGAAATAFLTMMLVMPPLIRYLVAKKLGEQGGKDEGAVLVDSMRQAKAGTPTMGGLGLIFCIALSGLLWCRPDEHFTWLMLTAMLGFGGIGFIDDRAKIFKGAVGISKRMKMALQIGLGLGCGLWLWWIDRAEVWGPVRRVINVAPEDGGGTVQIMSQQLLEVVHHSVSIPFLPLEWALPLGIGIVAWVLFMTLACSNSVNFTDGMDGLASGTVLICALAFVIIAYLTSRVDTCAYLGIFYVPGSQEVAIFCAGIVGACLGFLWFNAPPAKVFMGDTGSQALGGVLAVITVCVKQEFLLPVVGFIFFLEGASVLLQVGSYKLRGGKRIFLCAPIHHHFQYQGWPETRIVLRFWIIAALCALLALATLKLR